MKTHRMLFFVLACQLHAGEPYGVCAHVGGHEWASRDKTFALMKESGLGYVRSDFAWKHIQKDAQSWDYTRFDDLLRSATHANIKVLPILDYSVPFADPAYQHLDLWLSYVSNTVVRYKHVIRTWEVWNEQNLGGFWRNPNPADYLKLLKPTYALIKQIDPALTVAVGGFAGVPHAFIEGVYQAGGKDCFDIMNIHPYSQPMPPEDELEARITELRRVMKRYGDEKKPIWITEIGWPTQRHQFSVPGMLKAGTESILNEKPIRKVWLVDDPSLPRFAVFPKAWAESEFGNVVDCVTLDDVVARLESTSPEVLILPMNESFPAHESLYNYARNGGVIIALNGIPFYYGLTKGPTGVWQQDKTCNSAKWRERFRVNEEAFWHTRPYKIPPKVDVRGFGKKLNCERYFKPSPKMKAGDRFIPLLQGQQGDYTAVGVAVVDYNSDMKGGLLVSGIRECGLKGNTEEEQALFTVRALMALYSMGIEQVFTYEFHSPEGEELDQESHFGMVHKNYQPKPLYSALHAFAKMRPHTAAQTVGEWHRDGACFSQWKAGNVPAGSVWAYPQSGRYRCTFDADSVRLYDFSGKALQYDVAQRVVVLELSGYPIYFQGASLKACERQP